MQDPRIKTDGTPSPDRDTSLEGREEEVIVQQEANKVINAEPQTVVNGQTMDMSNDGERQFKEGMSDNTVKLDDAQLEDKEASDQTGKDESILPGGGI